MNHYLIEIAWSDEDEGFIATVPDLPGCSAWGPTAAEAASQIEDAQAAWIEACEASGEPVPQPMTPARRAA
jgi:predicted RNase H-like HicB family nuclease